MLLPERIIEKISPEPNSGCWLWTGATVNGYARVRWAGRNALAHRVVYELVIYPIADDLQIDHLCRVRSCVNPDHMEAVTHEENMRRARIQTCKRGHPFSGDNLYIAPRGTRECRSCRKMNVRAWHARKKEKTN